MRRLGLAAAIGMSAIALGGCSRSDDGSVTMADPLHVGRYLRPEPSPPTTPPVQSGLQVFPVSPNARPAGQARSDRPASYRKARRRSADMAAPPPSDKPIVCRDAMASGERVHVVCE